MVYPLVDREHNRLHHRKIRCGMQEHLALVQCLSDELVLFIVEFHYCLLEVPNTSMDELS